MKKVISLFILACIFLALAACVHGGSALEQKKWILDSYSEKNSIQQVLAGTEITALFEKGEGKVSGSAGCNTYSASYDTNGSSLSISNLSYTERGCDSPVGVMDQEQKFLSLIADAGSFQVDETKLTITCNDGSQLNFTAAK